MSDAPTEDEGPTVKRMPYERGDGTIPTEAPTDETDDPSKGGQEATQGPVPTTPEESTDVGEEQGDLAPQADLGGPGSP